MLLLLREGWRFQPEAFELEIEAAASQAECLGGLGDVAARGVDRRLDHLALDFLDRLREQLADEADLLRVHSADYIDRFRRLSAAGGGAIGFEASFAGSLACGPIGPWDTVDRGIPS